MRKKQTCTAVSLLETCASQSISHARKLARLGRWLHQHLPEPLNTQTKILNLRNQILILSTNSPVWATRLRYLAPELLSQLAQETSLNILKIQIKSRPTYAETSKSFVKKQKPALSSMSAAIISQTAADINHPGLSGALQRLAANANKP
jgi:hypothetical protein